MLVKLYWYQLVWGPLFDILNWIFDVPATHLPKRTAEPKLVIYITNIDSDIHKPIYRYIFCPTTSSVGTYGVRMCWWSVTTYTYLYSDQIGKNLPIFISDWTKSSRSTLWTVPYWLFCINSIENGNRRTALYRIGPCDSWKCTTSATSPHRRRYLGAEILGTSVPGT